MKKKIKSLGIVLLVLIVAAAAGIYFFRKPIIRRFSPQIEQLGNIQIQVKDDTTYVNARLAIHNVTSLQIEIDTLSYVISLFDKVYMQSSTDINVSMPSHGNDTIDFNFRIPHTELLKDAKIARKEDDSASYVIDASIQFATVFGRFDVPISKTSKIKIPVPPELEIVDLKYEKLGLRRIRALATIKVSNKNQVSLTIKELRYNLEIPTRAQLEGEYRQDIVIHAKDKTTFELPLDIELHKVGKTIFDIIRDRDIYPYNLHIVAFIETREPVIQTFNVDVIKNGEMELKK